MKRRLWIRSFAVVVIGLGWESLAFEEVRGEQPNRASARLEQIAQEFFAGQRDWRAGDLISQAEVQRLFAEIKRQGETVPGEKEMLALVLSGSDVLVRTLGTPEGRKFMRKVSGEQLIFDRLDRIARAPGGAQMLRDLVKLPDGERYAKYKTKRGVPDLLDLLPKDGSGKRRQIKDYDRPTGRIYTAEQLMRALSSVPRPKS
jgi:hypothetical protein